MRKGGKFCLLWSILAFEKLISNFILKYFYLRIHICTENVGWFYSISEGFLIIRIQNVWEKATLMCLIPILLGVVYGGSICPTTPFKGLAPINEV